MRILTVAIAFSLKIKFCFNYLMEQDIYLILIYLRMSLYDNEMSHKKGAPINQGTKTRLLKVN